MSKRALILITFLSITTLLILSQKSIIRANSNDRAHTISLQTIPTRTPTPSAITPPPTNPPPTNTPDSGGGGGGSNNTPVPTNPPAATATNTTVPVTIASTPIGGILPTAEPCHQPPTFQAFNNVNVRSGPGTNYDIVAQLIFQEVRPIVGRAEFTTWWLIEFIDGSQGWVADGLGSISGYVGNVLLVPPPALNGNTPTPETLWEPFSVPACTPMPTPLSTATNTPTLESPTATITTEPATTAIATTTATAVAETATATTENTPEPTATHTPVLEEPTATATLQSSPTPQPAEAVANETPPTATPLNEPEPTTSPNFLPLLGLGLVLIGVFMWVARRRQSE